jgi:hypothetical protein
MAKRKRNATVVKPEEPKKEETLPLVRTSDEPVVQKVCTVYLINCFPCTN